MDEAELADEAVLVCADKDADKAGAGAAFLSTTPKLAAERERDSRRREIGNFMANWTR